MTSYSKTIAVTGGTGFIGRALLAQLCDDDRPVRALTRSPASSNDIDWISGDLDNIAALTDLVGGADTVIHLAGLTKAPTRAGLFRANAIAAGRLASLAAKAGVRRFILVSSLAAREPHLSGYAASKRAGEDAVMQSTGDMEIVIIRPPAIIGPGDDATGQMLDAMRRGWLPVPGGRRRQTTRLSFMYVDDIARFILRQTDGLAHDGPLEPAVDEGGTSWATIAETASDILSKPVRLLPVSPVILFSAAFVTQTLCALFGQSTFFNTGKVREMLHTDWTGRVVMRDAHAFPTSLALAFGQDAAT